ncbi:MAG: hypothetical protein Ta2B_20450 [Termitinemataceae bacterium]|nr:MAG: hypothetical protein Ta2B_20450 [Termitinemataceae bacterium]
MKKNLLTKIILFATLYVVIFLAFSLIQFANQGSFSRQLGGLRVSGNFITTTQVSKQSQSDNFNARINNANTSTNISYAIEDGVGVYFGGMEFYLCSTELYALCYIDSAGEKHHIKPEVMVLSDESIKFKLQNSIDLSFHVQREGGTEELIISAVMAEDIIGIEVPYRPVKKAKIKSSSRDASGNASLFVNYSGQEYMFDRPILDTSRRTINLSNKAPVIVYKIVPAETTFNPVDFIVSGAMEKPRYNELVAAWCNKALKVWENAVFSGSNNEDIITAYVCETARKGSYHSAVDNVSESFITSGSRTYLSSPFLGKLDVGLRTLSATERDTTARYSTLIREKPQDILKEDRMFEYLALRGRMALFDEAVAYLSHYDMALVTEDMCAGIFEAWVAWWRWRENIKEHKLPFDTNTEVKLENPLTPLLEYAKTVLSVSTTMDSENRNIFITNNKVVDVLYNLRLGVAVEEYGNATQKGEWAALGRSFVLSVLNFADDAALIPDTLELNEENNFEKRQNVANIGTTTIYKNLRFSDFYPHAVGAGSVVNGVWIWTMSPTIAATYENNVFDISVSFPMGQTHYILINGIGSFSKIQMRDMDYRSDPQFERYDSPGWAYSVSERTLLLKLVHRNQVEHIKILF